MVTSNQQVTMSGMCTGSHEQFQPTPQHSTVPPIAKRNTMQSFDKPLQGTSANPSVGSGTQQTNIANITPDSPVDQNISPYFSADALSLPKHSTPTRGGRSDGNLSKIPESTSCERKVLRTGAAGPTQKTNESTHQPSPNTNEQALNLDQMSFSNCEAESIHEEQKFQVAATLLEFSSNAVATHTPELDFSCGSMSYSSGACSFNPSDREGDFRRVGLNDSAPAVKLPSVSGPQAAVGSGSKSSLWSSSTSLDLFRVEEERHMQAELGDSIISMQMGSLQMGSLNDSMLDMSYVSGEKDPVGRSLPCQQYAPNRTATASNKRKNTDDSLSDLLNGSLDFNDSAQEGKLETSASMAYCQVARQQRAKCGNGTNKAKTNANQRSPLDDVFHSSASSDETTVSHMSVTAGVS